MCLGHFTSHLAVSHHEDMDIAGWERMYHSGERGSEDEPTRLLVETAATLTGGAAVDLACGTGRNALFLAEHGWSVTAIDGSASAIELLGKRAQERRVSISAKVADLTAPGFALPQNAFDLILIAYYLQRDLFAKIEPALKSEGVVVAIVHTPEKGEPPSSKRAGPGELRGFFKDWEILHDYEGASRDPAHRRPVAEIVARHPQKFLR